MRNFIGTLIMLLGVTLFLQSSGIIDNQWTKDTIGSALIVAIGIIIFVWKRQAWAWALILALVGVTDFVENQQWPLFEKHTPWEYIWPVLVIVVGLHILLNRRQPRIKKVETQP